MIISYYGVFFLIGGLLMILLRKMKYQFFGYRTPRSMKSRNHFIYANLVAGKMCIIFGVVVLLLDQIVTHYTIKSLIGWPIRSLFVSLFISFFILLFIYIEINLKKIPEGDSKEE